MSRVIQHREEVPLRELAALAASTQLAIGDVLVVGPGRYAGRTAFYRSDDGALGLHSTSVAINIGIDVTRRFRNAYEHFQPLFEFLRSDDSQFTLRISFLASDPGFARWLSLDQRCYAYRLEMTPSQNDTLSVALDAEQSLDSFFSECFTMRCHFKPEHSFKHASRMLHDALRIATSSNETMAFVIEARFAEDDPDWCRAITEVRNSAVNVLRHGVSVVRHGVAVMDVDLPPGRCLRMFSVATSMVEALLQHMMRTYGFRLLAHVRSGPGKHLTLSEARGRDTVPLCMQYDFVEYSERRQHERVVELALVLVHSICPCDLVEVLDWLPGMSFMTRQRRHAAVDRTYHSMRKAIAQRETAKRPALESAPESTNK